MEVSEAPQSSIKRVVMKEPEPGTKKVYLEVMGETMKEGGKPFPNEVEKTPEQIEVINLVNKASDNFLSSLGLPAFTVPPENIHVVKEFENDGDLGGRFFADQQLAVVAEGRNLIEFANFVTHELLHFKSYGVMQLTPGQETLDFQYRGGFSAHSRDSQQPFFRTVDEALTELATQRVLEGLKKEKPSVLAKEIQVTEFLSQPIPPHERERFLFVESLPPDHPMRENGKTLQTHEYHYPEDRASLDMLVEKLFEKNSNQFSNKEEVLNLFLKGKFQGNFLQVGKLIDSTYGKGTFRNLGIISQSSEGFRLFVDALPSGSQDTESPEQRTLYRGVWADKIKDGDTLPVGGSIFSDELDIMLDIDTAWMDQETEGFTNERINEVFAASNREKFEKWAGENNINVDLDLDTLHRLYQVQMKMRKLLKVGDESVARERKDLYLKDRRAKLSDFIGRSECAEQAAVGKLLLDKLGVKSTLMEGVHVDSKDDYPSDHSFLIVDDPQGEGSLIFDIARPKASVDGFPRILRSDKKIDYSIFEGKNNYVIPVKDIYSGTTLYYGVGHSSLLQDVNFAE